MKNYIPLYGNNFSAVTAAAGIDHKELIKKEQESRFEHQRMADKQWALQKLGYDEIWWNETMQKISQIQASLPTTTTHQERTIAMYGWITTKKGGTFSLPMMDADIGHASAIEAILCNPSLYLIMSNWD